MNNNYNKWMRSFNLRLNIKNLKNKKINWKIKDKKGQTSFNQVMFLFVRLVILITIFISIVFITKKYVVSSTNIFDIESEIMLRSILTNKNGIVYYDKNNNYNEIFVIDPRNFVQTNEEERLNKVFNFGDDQKQMAAKITIYNLTGENYIYKSKDNIDQKLNPRYINEEFFDIWYDFSRARLLGPGSAKNKFKKYYVNMMDDTGLLEPAIVEIIIVIPNS